MRIIFFLPVLLLPQLLFARITDSTDFRFRTGVSYVYGMPLGEFSWRHSDRFITGQCEGTSGVSFILATTLSKHFVIGLQFTDVNYKINQERLYRQLSERYSKPGYFTTIGSHIDNFEVGSVAIEAAYVFHYRKLGIEPFIAIGVAAGGTGVNYSSSIHRKAKNENYSEDIYPVMIDNTTYFYPGLGIHLNKRIYKVLHAGVSCQYNFGISRYKIEDQQEDFMGNTHNTSQSFVQPVSALQIQAGIQLRFGVIGKHRKRKD